jgi:hypothetical protein
MNQRNAFKETIAFAIVRGMPLKSDGGSAGLSAPWSRLA